jgi:hypothetical protein
MKTLTRNILFGAMLLPALSTMIQAQTPAPQRSARRTADANQRTVDMNQRVAEVQMIADGARAPKPARLPNELVANEIAAVAAVNHGHIFDYDRNQKTFNEEDLKSKEVSKEISVPKGSEIYIENASRGIVVKTWDQPKVKVTTTIYYEGDAKFTDDEWLEKVNLTLKTLGTSVKVKSGSVGYNNVGGGYSSYNSGGSGVAVFDANGRNVGTKTNLKRIVTVTVPAGSKLDIESKYADVTLPAGIGDVYADITNGNLEADNLNKLILRSKYSNVNVGDVKIAEIEFNNGRFSAKTIDDLDIESKYSTIEMAAVKKVVLRSTNDEYELEDAGEIRGRKSYGNLRVTKLTKSLEIDGTNADVKIRNVGPTLSLVKIDNKYADVRIPLRETKNYSIDFAGSYSSVYGNFEKKPVTDEKSSSTTTAPSGIVVGERTYTSTYNSTNNSSNPSRFTATVGDGKSLKIDMKCQNCTVDFK